MFAYQTDLLISLALFLPGIYGVVRTRAWGKPRLWGYALVQPWLISLGINLPTPELRFWGGIIISMAILFAVESLSISRNSQEKKTAYAQFASFLLCCPLLDHCWDRYVGHFLYYGFSGLWTEILRDIQDLLSVVGI